MSRNRGTSRSGIVAAVLVGVTMALVPVALADKGGGGHSGTGGSGHKGGGSSATLSVDCNPCALDRYAHFTGSGFDGSLLRGMVAVTSGGSTTWAGIPVNADGTTSFDWYMSPTGTYDVKVFQQVHKKLVLETELSGIVVQ